MYSAPHFTFYLFNVTKYIVTTINEIITQKQLLLSHCLGLQGNHLRNTIDPEGHCEKANESWPNP
jgi:hypothetical protein